jgi:hypothetical protein
MRENGDPMNTLKPQPGQYDSYHPKFHPLPGVWAKEQLNSSIDHHNANYPTSHSKNNGTEISRALAAENAQHSYWEKWQGVEPGKPVYEDPRAFQNTLLPVAKFGTDGRGD